MDSSHSVHTVKSIRALKGERRIVALTAYDALFARWIDQAGVDLILVGDSVGTTYLGYPSTVPVTLEDIIHHTRAVVRSQPKALVVADLPFPYGRYSRDRLLEASARLLSEGGASAIKIETDASAAPEIKLLVDAGIPVIGHIGLLPQRYNAIGGYRRYGAKASEAETLLQDAAALEAAGCFCLLGEMIEASTAARITAQSKVPFIGIGCGKDCDGQILVSTDLLGLNPTPPPSFVKVYADLASQVSSAVAAYADDVREGKFP
jgi:3-methyl-2-oxobutanoate hydroxymethyltransferase